MPPSRLQVKIAIVEDDINMRKSLEISMGDFKEYEVVTFKNAIDALKKLDDSLNIHSALKSAYSKLYGYTSDKDGIRHSILEEPNLSFSDAKYMLVSCSAFINYLIGKYAENNMEL